jgi:chromosome segregation ATPase
VDYAEFEKRREAWSAKFSELIDKRRRAKGDINRLQRDAAAARLEVLDAKLHFADVETRIEKLRQKKPKLPERGP